MFNNLIEHIHQWPSDVLAIAGMFAIVIGSQILERFRVPSAVTCVLLGILIGRVLPFVQDLQLLKVFSILGISSLFLHAGLEVDIQDLRRHKKEVISILCFYYFLLWLCRISIASFFSLDTKSSWIFSLGLLTPSAGFILTSAQRNLSENRHHAWVKRTVIAIEICSLSILFFIMKGTSLYDLVSGAFLLFLLMASLPYIFKYFVRFIHPYAPHSEFNLLIILACAFAVFTKHLGVYYLVGAFMVGAGSKTLLQSIDADRSTFLLRAINTFSLFFVSFYFFTSGAHAKSNYLSFYSIALGAILAMILIPMRASMIILWKKWVNREQHVDTLRIGLEMGPTLVFGLVMADILDQERVDPMFVGSLLSYTVFTTIFPNLARTLLPAQVDALSPITRGSSPAEASTASGEPAGSPTGPGA